MSRSLGLASASVMLGGRVFLFATIAEPSQLAYIVHCIDVAQHRLLDSDADARRYPLCDVLHRAGVLYPLLAGLLVEAGRAWSTSLAAEQCDFFRELEDPEDQTLVRQAFAPAWRHFRAQAGAPFPKDFVLAAESHIVALDQFGASPTLQELDGSTVVRNR